MSEESISIPKELYKNLSKIASESGFENVNEYVIFVLEEIVSNQTKDNKIDENQREQIDDRLRKLGYL